MANIIINVQHKDGRFFVVIDGKEAELLYRINGNKMDIYHVFTLPELRGRGIAEQLAIAAFNYAKQKKIRVIPSCPYISETFLRKHKEFNNVVEQ